MSVFNCLKGGVHRCLTLLAAVVLTSGLTACGGSSETAPVVEDSPAEEQTKLMVSLTDAEGDFITYQVDVTNIAMTRANGAVVNILPQTTTVDFAQYVEVTELLTVLDAPVGRYTSASLTLNFDNAQITVQDTEGSPIPANAFDESGNMLGEITVTMSFNDRDGFVLSPGVPAHVTLDFDLDASNEVEIEGESATVTVNPVLIADPILEESKTFRLRGLLTEVSADDDAFGIELRPFRVRDGRFGNARVQMLDETSYEIDGELFEGENGLLALSEKDAGTAIVTEGYWDREAREYVAEVVYAGSSVPWDQADILRGTVVARSGDSLSVRGGIVQLSEGQFIFNDTFEVMVSELTNVTRRGADESSIAQISVGSAIYALGEMTDDASFDASEGSVRIIPSSLSGTVVNASPLVMDLTFFNGRYAAIYDFAGTGTSSDTDADPENYEIFTDTLDLSGVEMGAPIRARGFASDFGTAPEDFSASTIIDASNVRAHMVVNYGIQGSETAVESLDENGLLLDVSEALHRHHIVVAGIPVDLQSLEQAPLVVPGDERGIYSIWINGRVEVYTFYTDFMAALADDLSDGTVVLRLDAQGYYDSSMATFTSRRLGIMLRRN